MRTTLTIDPDVEELLRRDIRRTGRSMKSVVNDALRAGLGVESESPGAPRYKAESYAFGFKPDVDVDRLNRLVDEMEVEEIVLRLKR